MTTRARLCRCRRGTTSRAASIAASWRLVAEHRIEEDEAHELAPELAHGLAKKAYRL